VIAPPGRNPSINIRLYEQKPVRPEWLLEREVMNPEMMDILQQAMEKGYRILISGGTRTGKTTLLSALCNFLPQGWHIVKIEDPEEIWVDRPTVQTVEARPQAVGTDVKPYTLADGVDDAMRMSPDYLVIGEVRDGIAAMSLFRALMTGHSGACTFHADSPREAARRLATVMGAEPRTGALEKCGTMVCWPALQGTREEPEGNRGASDGPMRMPRPKIT
jgi:pilus assembly protein CpaF